ncbi:YcaO-like family protein [Streptomyces beihaiensis]|uniref:YcaO-like family protein n=1 Tax=Streptomyces beihaiensis TaxID=2984495 RepID=A0ABT3U2V7_9ACTN|nr:YcaO-like family protein [Streptomyces beihaiensis]MCX3063653.1 YcaO-like family protein [Streptomyces beihaiensis]
MKKVYFDGTHRVRRPEETWDAIDPLRETFGITRVADVTGLDRLGVPVALAARPAARSYPLSPGKGTSPLSARISAVLAAAELWHAEYACPQPAVVRTPARDLLLPYGVEELRRPAGSLLGERTPLDWVSGNDAVSGAPVLVPRACVTVDHDAAPAYRPPLLTASTEGLAAGNSRAEAVTHALYEVIERDCAASGGAAARRRGSVDATEVDDARCAALLRRVVRAGARPELFSVPNRWDLPCFAARVSAPGLPAAAVGWGVHSAPGVALARALTAAAQRRLLDLTAGPGAPHRDRPAPAPLASADGCAEAAPWRELARKGVEFTEDAEEMRWLAGRFARVTGRPPLVVDLSTEDAFSVVKVITPRAG